MMNILSRRDAERAERLLAIDESWLRTRGEVIRDDDDAFGVRICDKANAILQRPTVFTKVLKQKPGTALNMNIDGCRLSVVVETRGELLDWERVLKGGA